MTAWLLSFPPQILPHCTLEISVCGPLDGTGVATRLPQAGELQISLRSRAGMIEET